MAKSQAMKSKVLNPKDGYHICAEFKIRLFSGKDWTTEHPVLSNTKYSFTQIFGSQSHVSNIISWNYNGRKCQL